MYDWPVVVIPNPLDTDRWRPIHKGFARSLLDLPQDKTLLLFGAFGGTDAHHKGFDILLSSLSILSSEKSHDSLHLVVFGQSEPKSPPKLGFPVHFLGHLYDDLSLRALYSACDAMVIPSRQDNLPYTGLEAHACGTPVVAFDTCGLKDIVDHGVTGALADPFDPHSLAASLAWVIEDSSRLRSLSQQARLRAKRLWSYNTVGTLYSQLYSILTSTPNEHSPSN